MTTGALMSRNATTTDAPPALSIRRLTVELQGRVLIHDASVDFAAGTSHAVIGRSGAGKSVLLKAAVGLLPRRTGSVLLHRRPLVFVHQDPALLDDLDVEENVAFPLLRKNRSSRPDVRRRVRGLLEELSLAHLQRERPADLTPSEARRVALARALALQPAVLIVDEPTTGLDPIAADDVETALLRSDPDRTLILITHHPRTWQRLATSTVLVEQGRVRRIS